MPRDERMTEAALQRAYRMWVKKDGDFVNIEVLYPERSKLTRPAHKQRCRAHDYQRVLHAMRQRYRVPAANITLEGFKFEGTQRPPLGVHLEELEELGAENLEEDGQDDTAADTDGSDTAPVDGVGMDGGDAGGGAEMSEVPQAKPGDTEPSD